MKIYNRYGQLIFASANPGKGWDGNYASQPQPIGTYVWTLSYKDGITGNEIRKEGTLVLIR
jgi:gliding motility-associated-like protein